MKYSHNRLLAATALAVGVAIAVPLATGAARAADKALDAADPGFVPDTGQINLGIAIQGASQSYEVIKIPTPQQARAAWLTPVSTQPSTGDQTPGQPGAATTGAAASGTVTAPAASPANGEPPPSGPIGSIGQTLPAKFSPRNDVLDRVPTMAWPLSMSDQQRQQIYQAVMADKSEPAAGADKLTLSSFLTVDQALNGIHALPSSVSNIAEVKGLAYVKAKNKVLLVEPATRVVVDEITS
jgi:hypothetical protein